MRSREREAGEDFVGGSRRWIGRVRTRVWPGVERCRGKEGTRGGVGSRDW